MSTKRRNKRSAEHGREARWEKAMGVKRGSCKRSETHARLLQPSELNTAPAAVGQAFKYIGSNFTPTAALITISVPAPTPNEQGCMK